MSFLFKSGVLSALCFVAASALAQAQPEPPPAIVPPEVITRVDAVLPPDALAAGTRATVVLTLTVDREGAVTDVVVSQSGGDVLDAAATAAVMQWRFKPATQNGLALASRINVPFEFESPPVVLSTPEDQVVAPVIGLEAASLTETETPIEVTVQGERELRSDDRSVSDFHVQRDVLQAAPRSEGAEVLRSAPGLYIGRGEGAAVAHSYMLRGFDADHGQDIELRVGGLPINQPSHIHGQGYADLGFLIGDVVQELHVTEGVYDPRQGDFAVAGSINIDLGVEESQRGIHMKSGLGAFGTQRHQLRWAPEGAERETFGAVQYSQTDGFGQNRAGEAGSALVQARLGQGAWRYRVLGILHAARADTAGVVRADDVDSGRVCFTCVYPNATARAQNAMTQRVMLGFFIDYRGERGDNAELGAWVGHDNFRIQSNFTGFTQSSRTLARTAGRGDLIEQRNSASSLGIQGRYRSASYRPAPDIHGTVEVGIAGRMDAIDQAQNLLDATARNQTWDRRVDASIHGMDLGFWADLDWSVTQYVKARAGIRADVLAYDIDDRLGNFAPLVRPQDTYIVGYRRSALGTAWGPRTSVEVLPLSFLSVRAAYGEGYRSPQARMLDDGEQAPFTKVRSADLGVRFDGGDPIQLTVGGYYTHLSDDVAFDAEEGRLERIGATQRLGAVIHAASRPWPWLVGAFSVTLVDASLLEPPPATVEQPQPPFVKGQNLPFVPPVVLRADIGANHVLLDNAGPWKLSGRLGSGLSFLSSRPLPYGQSADPFALLDMSAGLTWGPLDLSLEIYNLLDSQYAALAYSFASSWDPDAARSRVPMSHTAAGSPRSWMLSLGVSL